MRGRLDEENETLEEFQERWRQTYARINTTMSVFIVVWGVIWIAVLCYILPWEGI